MVKLKFLYLLLLIGFIKAPVAFSQVNDSVECPTPEQSHKTNTSAQQQDKPCGSTNDLPAESQPKTEPQTPEHPEPPNNENEERLKVLFVDVNTVMESVGWTMDWTANWIDGYFSDTEQGKNKAKAWGHIVMGWEPRDGEWGNFPVQFKVKAKLPNLKNKVELILTDDEDEDFKTLPYESVRPEAYKSSQRSLGAAVQFLHAASENIRTSSRLGYGDSQIYARSSLTYRKKYLDQRVTLNIQPAIEYYVEDGWGARFLLDTGYKFTPEDEVRFNYSLQERESFDAPEWRKGLYSINAINDKSALITGISSVGVVEPEYTPEFHKFSVRYRRKAIRSWIFIEAEPFVQFQRELITDNPLMAPYYESFQRDIGIAFRIEAHYGFL